MRDNTRRFMFGESRSSQAGSIRTERARPGYRLHQMVGYFGVPFRDLRLARLLRMLPAVLVLLALGSVAVEPARAAADNDTAEPLGQRLD